MSFTIQAWKKECLPRSLKILRLYFRLKLCFLQPGKLKILFSLCNSKNVAFDLKRFVNIEILLVSGVMSFVGKAIEEHRQNQKKQADRVENESNTNVRAVNPVLIGFVPWNIVRGRVNLKKKG